MKIKDKIKDLRMELGYSQQGLSKKLGVSNAYLSMLESGKANISIKIAEILSKLAETNINYFLFDDDELEEQYNYNIDDKLNLKQFSHYSEKDNKYIYYSSDSGIVHLPILRSQIEFPDDFTDKFIYENFMIYILEEDITEISPFFKKNTQILLQKVDRNYKSDDKDKIIIDNRNNIYFSDRAKFNIPDDNFIIAVGRAVIYFEI